MQGKFWMRLAETTTARKHPGSGLVFSHRDRRGRQARPSLDFLEDRCLLSFGSASLYSTGAVNTAVAIGDVNQDGFADIVTTTTSNDIRISLGYGDGTVRAPLVIAVPGAASFTSVKLADLDGRNGLDIIAADPADQEIWVLLNQGGGTFGTPTALATGTDCEAIAVLDLSGDGNPDIVTANSADNSVSVFIGQGDGTFPSQTNYAVNQGPVAVAIGDFFADGHPDLVTANSKGNSDTLLRGNGDGTFRPGLDIPITLSIDGQNITESNPSDVAVGDFNGDGFDDVVTATFGPADSNQGGINVMLGNGDGSFGVQRTTTISVKGTPTDKSPTAVVAADFDGDGYADIATTEPDLSSVSVFVGMGDGTFAPEVNYVDQVVGKFPSAVALGNLNGDQTSFELGGTTVNNPRLDLVTVAPNDQRFAVLLGQRYAAPTTLGVAPSTITWGDSLTVKPDVSTGYNPPVGPLTGAFQLMVDGNSSGVPVPVGGAFSFDRLTFGRHTLAAHYLGDLNYDPQDTSTVIINVVAAKLTLTALDQTRSYGSVNPLFTYVIKGFVAGEFLDQSKVSGTPVFTTAAGSSSPVGTYSITIAQGALKYADLNYTFDPRFLNGKLTITPAPLVVSINRMTRLYGQANAALTPIYSGFVNGETLATSDLTGSPDVSTSAAASSQVGTYPLFLGSGSLSSSHYSFSFVTEQLEVTPALLTVTPVVATRVYGAAAPVMNYTVTGFVNGDTSGNAYTGKPGLDTPTSPVGSYPFTPSLGSLDSTNYTFTFLPATLTVTPVVLTVTAGNASRPYGSATPD